MKSGCSGRHRRRRFRRNYTRRVDRCDSRAAWLGLQYSDGIYFTDPTSGASAIVLQQGSSYIVAFRGTDDQNDILHYPELLTGTYIHHYDPLLNA